MSTIDMCTYFQTRFLENLLHDLPSVVQLLPPKILHQLWKGFGWIIRAEKNDAVSRQLLLHVMTVPNMVVTPRTFFLSTNHIFHFFFRFSSC